MENKENIGDINDFEEAMDCCLAGMMTICHAFLGVPEEQISDEKTFIILKKMERCYQQMKSSLIDAITEAYKTKH